MGNALKASINKKLSQAEKESQRSRGSHSTNSPSPLNRQATFVGRRVSIANKAINLTLND